MVIICCYKIQELLEKVDQDLLLKKWQACKKAIFLIDGDFNCSDIYWNDSY